MKRTYPICLSKDHGFYVVYISDFNVNTQGRTVAEAKHMARDVISLCIEHLQEQGKAIPDPTPIDQLAEEGRKFVSLPLLKQRIKKGKGV